MNYLANVGERICILRKKQGITQEELAFRTGYTSRSSINKIEKGLVDLPQSKIVEIAEVLGTTPSHLMGWDDEKTNNLHVQGFNLQMFSDPATASPSEALSEGERALLELFRQLPEESQTMYLEVLRATLKSLAKD